MPDSLHPINDLKHALAAGEEEAFGELLDAVGARLRRAAYRMLGSEADADDAVQEVFVALVKSRHRLVTVENLNAYLFTMLHRVAAKFQKRKKVRPASCDSLDELAHPKTSDPSKLHEEGLNQALKQLPPEQREVIVLKTDAQLTFAEIGRLLGVSANTAASRYRYGLEKLRVKMRCTTC